MGRRVAIVAFNGDPEFFAHVLLNALDMNGKGYEVKVVVEGGATRALVDLSREGQPYADLCREARGKGMIDCVCGACAAKTGALEGIEALGLPLRGEMKGHPSIAAYMEQGYQVMTF
ncbi:MAG: DsrE family protein [Thermodesulfobacteriota bacterium]